MKKMILAGLLSALTACSIISTCNAKVINPPNRPTPPRIVKPAEQLPAFALTKPAVPNQMDIVFILDKSGSMYPLEGDTIGGFNGLIDKQKEAGNGDKALVSVVLFNNRSQLLYERLPLNEITQMTKKDYSTQGTTALLDAMGDTITQLAKSYETDEYLASKAKPKVLCVIITDGQENASREYTYEDIHKLISAQQEKGWEFLFLGANIDAIKEASRLGIRQSNAATYRNDSVGVQKNFKAVHRAMASYAEAGSIAADWSAEVKEHEKSK